MAIIFVPMNGIGLGHVSRSFSLARGLRELGESPVIFSQGIYPDFMAAEIPGRTVGALYYMAPAVHDAAVQEIANFARASPPAVVIEDTHPADIRFAPDICTILVVRPVQAQSMRDLRQRETGNYHFFLIADHPDSPTWPYDEATTREVLSWSGWKIMGPVFRVPTPEGRAQVRRKYRLQPGQPLYVFSMGGGGSQPGVHDAIFFLEQAGKIASRLRDRSPQTRLIYIRGPLFPPDFKVPPPFEDYAIETDMPSLLAESDGVIGRASMNLTWESIGAGVPCWPLLGTTWVDPVAERLERQRALGLVARDLEEYLDPAWRAQFRSAAAALSARWPLVDAARIMQSCFPAPAI